MRGFLQFITLYLGHKNIINEKNAYINLLDIGCSSSIPSHFVDYAHLINIYGCDPEKIGIAKVKAKKYIKKFNSVKFENVGASKKSKKSFLEISKKITGSKVRDINNIKKNLLEIDLVKTSNLQNKFDKGSANIIKIDAEGHELDVIKGINFDSEDLLCVEVECSLNPSNYQLSQIIKYLEENNFFIATLRYHNNQTLNVSSFENNFLVFIYKSLRKIPIIKNFNDIWTDLSGKSYFNSNKSFLSQLEFVFLKKEKYIKEKNLKIYKNILIIYGFLRYINPIKAPKILKFLIKYFPSR